MSRRPIHVFEPVFRTGEILEAMRDPLEKGWTGFGYRTLDFEKAWCEYTGLPHAHFLNSASAALHLAVRILKDRQGWNDGDEVITTPFTFVSSNHAILYERLTPVFADIDEHLCLDPESVAGRIGPRTRAIQFVGIGGNPGRLPEIVRLCREHGLALILDGAHMAGTWLQSEAGEEHMLPEADACIFSFHAVKNLPTADSGMVCFRDAESDRLARQMSWLGIDKDTYTRTVDPDRRYKWQYDVPHVGFKYHGNSIMAAMGLVGLRYLEEDNDYRRQLARWYDEALDGVNVTAVPMAASCRPSRHLYQVLSRERNELVVHLNEQDIYPGVHYHDNRLYPMYAQSGDLCPRVTSASEQVLSLPMHLNLTRPDVERVAAAIKAFVGMRGAD